MLCQTLGANRQVLPCRFVYMAAMVASPANCSLWAPRRVQKVNEEKLSVHVRCVAKDIKITMC